MKPIVEKAEEIKEEVKYFCLNTGIWQFRKPRHQLEGIKKKLDKLQRARKPKGTVEEHTKKLIIGGLKFNKHVTDLLNNYVGEQPTLQEVVEGMKDQLYDEIHFKDDSDGQTKLVTKEEIQAAIPYQCINCGLPLSDTIHGTAEGQHLARLSKEDIKLLKGDVRTAMQELKKERHLMLIDTGLEVIPLEKANPQK